MTKKQPTAFWAGARHAVPLLIVVIGLLLQGCGRKGPPVPPPEEGVQGQMF